jgi:hypothetical protein
MMCPRKTLQAREKEYGNPRIDPIEVMPRSLERWNKRET